VQPVDVLDIKLRSKVKFVKGMVRNLTMWGIILTAVSIRFLLRLLVVPLIVGVSRLTKVVSNGNRY
jgi:hypothetical protein